MRCSCRVSFFLHLERRSRGRVPDSMEELLSCGNTASIACLLLFVNSIRHAVEGGTNETDSFRDCLDTFDARAVPSVLDSKSLRQASDWTTIGSKYIRFFFGALSMFVWKLFSLLGDRFRSMFASYILIIGGTSTVLVSACVSLVIYLLVK